MSNISQRTEITELYSEKCRRILVGVDDTFSEDYWHDCSDNPRLGMVTYNSAVRQLFRVLHFCRQTSIAYWPEFLERKAASLGLDALEASSENDLRVHRDFYLSRAACAWLLKGQLALNYVSQSSGLFERWLAAAGDPEGMAAEILRTEGEESAELVFHAEFLRRVLSGDYEWVRTRFDQDFAYLSDAVTRRADGNIILFSDALARSAPTQGTTAADQGEVKAVFNDLRETWHASVLTGTYWGPGLMLLYLCGYALLQAELESPPSPAEVNALIGIPSATGN